MGGAAVNGRAALVVVALLAAPASAAPPAFADVRAAWVSSEALIVDRNNVPLSEVRADARVRRLDWIALADVSPAFSGALIAAEDRRFLEHHGVDWPGMAAAAWDSLWRTLDGRRVRGGSTPTMQLAGLLDPALAPSGAARSVAQKWDQAQTALALERAWSKAEILEAYLNLATYRGELQGLDAAARGLFGKTPAGLDAREAALIVALLRGPNASVAVVGERACGVAAQASPAAPCTEIRALASAALAGRYRIAPRWDMAPHLAAKLPARPGERLRTTLDAAVQRQATEALAGHLAELAERGVEDGAVLVLDNATGDVLAYVGSSGALSAAARVDGVTAPRQAGSTLKPFLYALALDARLLTAASLVDDSPLAIATARGLYAPQNYDRNFHGLVSVRSALGNSLNVPAVRTLALTGLDRFHDTLVRLGFDTLTQAAEHYGAALALGGADVTLLALTNAYRALANRGVHSRTRVVPATGPVEERRVFGAAASFVVADILADRGARALAFGLENPLATRVRSAVKTGTSKDMRDNWCVGFTSRYTVGVWVGNFSGAPMRDVSGVTGAAPIWRDVVHFLHAEDLPADTAAAPGLVRAAVRFDPPVEAARDEWFLRGTEMAVVRSSRGDPEGGTGSTPRIRYPSPDTVIALDPDLPAGRQRVLFEAAPVAAGLLWRLDGAPLADVRGRAAWTPRPGAHTLALEDATGRVLSAVAFEVRGDPAAIGTIAAP